jgi:hypothetical protein
MLASTASSATLSNEDVFNTPRSSNVASGLLSPAETPLRGKVNSICPTTSSSTLAINALRILEGTKLSPETELNLVNMLNQYDLRSQGVARGRDITRIALGNKEQRIAELETKVSELEAEQKTSKVVIAHLKRDIVHTSPGKGRKHD